MSTHTTTKIKNIFDFRHHTCWLRSSGKCHTNDVAFMYDFVKDVDYLYPSYDGMGILPVVKI